MLWGVMHVQVLACFGVSDKSALLDHMSVGEVLHLIHVRPVFKVTVGFCTGALKNTGFAQMVIHLSWHSTCQKTSIAFHKGM